ncbi:MAG: hypothetical protein U0892_10075 [Pirellulales bacterium]
MRITIRKVAGLSAVALVWFVQGHYLAQPAAAQLSSDAFNYIEPGGKGVAEAHQAIEQLAKSGSLSLEKVLRATKGTKPVAKNWLLGLAQSVADKSDPKETNAVLNKLLADQTADPEARYWALDRLAGSDAAAREKLLADRVEDSSLDIRYEAIELALGRLKDATDAAKDKPAEAAKIIPAYKTLLASARLPEQVNAIAAKLKDLRESVDVQKQFGFVNKWNVVAPFDNRNGIGFATAYPPEAEYMRVGKLDVQSSYPGKTEMVKWTTASTEKPDGAVDLNPVFAKEKGATAYAYVEFTSAADVDCEVRLGCINANKVWVNQQEAFANEVYHTGAQIDQYIGAAHLKKGRNTILVKVCQNEQTESWAQDWAFQLRFSDATGKAIPVTVE